MSDAKPKGDTTARVAAFLLLLGPALLLRAVVTQCLWMWFLTPLGAPAVSFYEAYGLVLTWAFVLTRRTRKGEKRPTGADDLRSAGNTIGFYLFTLALSWCVHGMAIAHHG